MGIVSVPTMPKHLRQKFRFGIQIAGFDAAYFTKIDRPKISFDEVEFNPAGSHRPEKLPGRMSFGDITFEKGVAATGADIAVLRWLSRQADFVSGRGGAPASILYDVTVFEGNRMNSVVSRYTLIGAFVKEYDGGELSGEDSDNIIESVTLSYQYLQF